MYLLHRRRHRRAAEAETKAGVAAWISDVMATVDEPPHNERMRSVLDVWSAVEDLETAEAPESETWPTASPVMDAPSPELEASGRPNSPGRAQATTRRSGR
jgi:hypothetical protein